MAPAKKSTKKKASSRAADGMIEIDLNEVEVRETYDGDDPRPGFYTFELVSVREHTSQAGKDGIAWIFALRDDALYEGWVRTVHSNTLPKGTDGSTLWKTGEILVALAGGNSVKGTKAAKVSLNLKSEQAVANFIKKAKLVRGRVQKRRDSDDDDPQFELGKIIALDEAKLAARRAAEAALEEDDEDEDEDGFEDADEFDDADEEDSDEEDDDESDEDEEEDEDDESDDDEDEEEDEEEDEDDEDFEEEDDEPEPEPEPVKKKAAKKTAAPAKKAKAKVTPIEDAPSKKKKAAKKK